MAFHDLSNRLVLTVLSLAIVFTLLLFSSHLIGGIAILFFLLALTGMALWEYGRLVKLNKKRGALSLMIGLGIAIVLSFFLYSQSAKWAFIPIGALIGSGIVLLLAQLCQIKEASQCVATSFFGLCYIAVPLGLLLLILYLEGGPFYLGYLIIVTKGADIGAYLGGRLLGKRALAPKLSPKKTVEGALIGLAVSVGLSLFLAFVGRGFEGFSMTLLQSALMGVLFGIFGQIGDLAESLFKREAGVKDSHRLPGLGGILDMLDSLLLTLPILYLFLLMT